MVSNESAARHSLFPLMHLLLLPLVLLTSSQQNLIALGSANIPGILFLHCCELLLGSSDLLFTELAGHVRTVYCSIASVDYAIAHVV